MPNPLDAVDGKVFVSPGTQEGYGPIGVPLGPTSFSTLDGTSFNALAEDPCGNYFTLKADGGVWFWDHETDDMVQLASSVSEFIAHCGDAPLVELDPSRVKKVWIDPALQSRSA